MRAAQALTIAIVGCGYVGTPLADQLAAAGHHVTAVRRSDAGEPLHPDVHLQRADVTHPDLALPPCDVLVYAVSAGGYADTLYRAAYVDGLRNTLRALGDSPPRLGLFVSSTAVYGQTDGQLVDEESATEPTGFSGRILLEGEHIMREACACGVAVRLAGIYGPGRTRLIDSVRSGTARIPPEPHFTNRIHRDDCAGILRFLIDRYAAGAALAPVILGVDHLPARYDEVVHWLADRLRVPRPPVAESPARRTRPESNKRCSNARITAMGYRFAYPTFRDGYAPMLPTSPGEP